MKKYLLFLFIIFLVISCKSKENENKIQVSVSIVPQKFFVEQIARDKVDVNIMIKPGYSPATYEPLPVEIKKIASSKLLFSIGVPSEVMWLEKIKSMYDDLIVVDTTKGIDKKTIGEHTFTEFLSNEKKDIHHDHQIEHDHSHENESFDPHVWLSPELVKIQAENIADALIKIDNKNADFYKKNLQSFKDELSRLSNEIREKFSELDTKNFLVFHPAWGYFSDEFDLNQISVEIEGKEPSLSVLQKIIDYIELNDIKVIFVQKEFSSNSADVIANEINGSVVVLDPLAEDYINNLKKISEDISENIN